jgi:hypothetical protein
MSLLELQESIEMPLGQVWLALLLNGMTLEQRGDFYQTEQVWICAEGISVVCDNSKVEPI